GCRAMVLKAAGRAVGELTLLCCCSTLAISRRRAGGIPAEYEDFLKLTTVRESAGIRTSARFRIPGEARWIDDLDRPETVFQAAGGHWRSDASRTVLELLIIRRGGASPDAGVGQDTRRRCRLKQ